MAFALPVFRIERLESVKSTFSESSIIFVFYNNEFCVSLFLGQNIFLYLIYKNDRNEKQIKICLFATYKLH
jgi:hypothetical protein